MRREVGFQRFYTSLYDGMRLLYRRMFNEKVVDIEYVENILNQSESQSFSEETSMLKAVVRSKCVVWLTGLSSVWEFEEKWREDVPRLPGLKRRTGSISGGKPGKAKRRR